MGRCTPAARLPRGAGCRQPGAPAAPAAAPGGGGKQGFEGAAWVVVGGKASGGIQVRSGAGLKTSELGRLSTGARVEQMGELEGERLHYKKVEGDGPDFGWVSLTLKGKDLVVRA
mmetsp:Transcript_111263/g.359179  ORF Transcript_111263/g.359179 Transcript_111263/m.359179 type:complete len:115 (-) Transcript_111263:77-421(-)